MSLFSFFFPLLFLYISTAILKFKTAANLLSKKIFPNSSLVSSYLGCMVCQELHLNCRECNRSIRCSPQLTTCCFAQSTLNNSLHLIIYKTCRSQSFPKLSKSKHQFFLSEPLIESVLIKTLLPSDTSNGKWVICTKCSFPRNPIQDKAYFQI